MVGRTRKQVLICAVLLVSSFNLWLATVATTQIHEFAPSAFYYAERLNPTYWLGIILLFLALGVLSNLRNNKNRGIYVALLLVGSFLLVLFVFGTSSIVYDNTRFNDVYKVVGIMRPLLDTGKIDLSGSLNYAQSYPGSLVFFEAMAVSIGVSPVTYARLHPVLIVFGLCLFSLAGSRRVGAPLSVLSPLAVVALAWPQEFHMAPQSVGVLLLGLFLLLQLIGAPIETRANPLALSLAALIAALSLTVSHPGSPLVLLLSLLLSAFGTPSRRVVWKRLKQTAAVGPAYHRSRSLVVPWLARASRFQVNTLVMIAIIWVSWLLFVARDHFVFLLNFVIEAIQNLLLGGTALYGGGIYGITGSPVLSLEMVNGLRIGIALFEICLAILAIRQLSAHQGGTPGRILVGWLLGAMSILLIGAAGGGFFTGRALVFLIVPEAIAIPLFVSSTRRSLQWRRRVKNGRRERPFSAAAVLPLVAATLLAPLTVYGGDAFEFRPDSSFSMRDFVQTHNVIVSNLDVDFGLNFAGPAIAYDCYVHKGIQLRTQRGYVYSLEFEKAGLSKVYDSGCSSLFIAQPL